MRRAGRDVLSRFSVRAGMKQRPALQSVPADLPSKYARTLGPPRASGVAKPCCAGGPTARDIAIAMTAGRVLPVADNQRKLRITAEGSFTG